MDAEDFRGTARFDIRRRLGAGGMGVVYEAYDRDQHVNIALKTIRAPSPDAILRLKNEFRALQDIQHRNLVSLGELFEEQGVWFFTMELIHGTTLLEYLRPGAPHVWSSEATARTDIAPSPPTQRPTAPVGGSLSAAITAESARPAQPVASAFDEPRVRDALAQLSRGLLALHRAGKVHRDVKPSNILVDGEGRVVLLDFGLVADTERAPLFSEVGVVGTAAYMAPEQALGKPVGPEADWYSVGVVLYEALTGCLPFAGSSMHILMEKQRQRPSRPVTHIADVPADLDRMCVELLEFDPHKRPSGAAIMRTLGASESPSMLGMAPLATRSSSTLTQSFVGREAELEFLAAALDDVRAGRLVCTYVHGESGIGKSALVHTFCRRASEDERVTVLAGRCYEREAVPYRVLDGVIDALARYLQRLPKHEAAALIPHRVSLLLQVFPVLKRVDVFADAPRHDAVDPQELRTRAFGALRELFARLSDRRTLIVAIDDLQWADVDGLALLSELMRPPDAPAFLLLGSWREAGEETVGVRKWLDALPGEARHIKLARLPEDAARDLAERLLAHAGAAGANGWARKAASIAREAVGHPLFIDELVRYSALAVDPLDQTNRPVKLEEVLWARIGRLDPPARRVLEVITVAGAPIDQDTAAHAAGMDLGTLGRHAALLRVSNLVRTTGSRPSDTVEPYHDRVRTALLSHLDQDVLVTRHRELARALDASGHADPEDLVEHYRGARELGRAGQCAAQAGGSAAQALAFDRAARLYRLALELLPDDDPARRELRVKLGDALANAGRGPEAARAYLEASQGAGAAETLDLQLRAAKQFMVSGFIDDGIVTMRRFLEHEGIHYPATPRAALTSVVMRRAQLALRGLRFKERDESLVSPKELKRLDACYHVGLTLGLVDNIRGQYFNARGLLLALKAGEPYRLARALATEAGFRAPLVGEKASSSARLFDIAETLARKVSNPHALALVLAARAQTAYLAGHFRESVEQCEHALEVLRERCVGALWEVTALNLWSCRGQQYMGEFDQLARRVPDLLREFARINNAHAATTLRVTVSSLLQLVADDPAQARAEIAEALTQWSPAGFHVQHYYAHVSETQSLLYEGRAAEASALVRERWPLVERAFLMRIRFIRGVMLELRARTALASAQASRNASERQLRLAEAARDARALRKTREPWTDALARLVEAGVALGRGDQVGARTDLERAADELRASDLGLHAAAARLRLGELLGGDEGRDLILGADAWMSAERIKRSGRMAAMLAPVVPRPGSAG